MSAPYRHSVLVVDDEKAVRDAIAEGLQRRGYDVVSAKNGREALFYRSQEKFDVMILDIMMPMTDGMETLRRLRAELPDAVVIMLTAAADPDGSIEASARRLGAAEFLRKPVHIADLEKVIRNVLRGSPQQSASATSAGSQTDRHNGGKGNKPKIEATSALIVDPDMQGGLGLESSRRYSVLVVDDEDAVRSVMHDALIRDGYDVVTARNAREAIICRFHKKFDVVILDIRMPKVDGLELLRELKARFRDVAVIVLTAVANPDGSVEALARELGACEFLHKPIRLQELRHTLKRVLAEDKRPTIPLRP